VRQRVNLQNKAYHKQCKAHTVIVRGGGVGGELYSGKAKGRNTFPETRICVGTKGWYWPQGLLSMPTDNSHKSWETPSDRSSVSCASKSHFLTSSIVIGGQCNFSCSRQERMEASLRRLETENFG